MYQHCWPQPAHSSQLHPCVWTALRQSVIPNPEQEKKMNWRCVAMAYYADGTPKRDVGTYYPDLMDVYTKDMAIADVVLPEIPEITKPRRKKRVKKINSNDL